MSLHFASIEVFIQFPFSFIDCLVQVMGFLLKVKRAKFALDKARRWMWKVLVLSLFFLHVIPDMVFHLLVKADSSSNQTRTNIVSKAMNPMSLLLCLTIGLLF